MSVATASAPAPALASAERADDRALPADSRFVVAARERRRRARLDGGDLFGVAGITDQVDGWLARRWHVESEFGKYADPLADRLMIDAAVIMLFIADRLPWPALAVIVARDALLLVGTRFVLPRGYEFSVSLLGKAATWVLYAGVAVRDRHARRGRPGRSGSSGSASAWPSAPGCCTSPPRGGRSAATGGWRSRRHESRRDGGRRGDAAPTR